LGVSAFEKNPLNPDRPLSFLLFVARFHTCSVFCASPKNALGFSQVTKGRKFIEKRRTLCQKQRKLNKKKHYRRELTLFGEKHGGMHAGSV